MLLCLLILSVWPQDSASPLPDVSAFLAEFRKTLHRDETLLGQYTYTETETHVTLDSNGKTKKTETSVYQVLHSTDPDWTYRRLISKDGVALSETEIAKHDREAEERRAKRIQSRENQSETKRQQEKAKTDREEEQTLDDVFAAYDIQLIRREVVDGRPVILLTFKAKPNYKPKTREGKVLQHIAGRAWIAEDDHQLAKLEAEVIDPISLGAGLLAKLQKGTMLSFERRKINNEIWLPVKAEIALNARLLLFKGLNFRQVNEYSDHKKYTVDTILKFGDVPLPAKPNP